jgi:NAD(P)-dependent dehydrogenase (short-subunit alcohol dehydrogenase family)
MKKVILITGVSSGFGKSAAARLAANGHTVYGTVRKPCEVDPLVHVLTMDLLDKDSIAAAVRTVVEEQGRIDVLINNAGMHLGGPIEEAPEELFRRQMETNVYGLVHVLQAALPYLRSNPGSTIVNFSSIGGLMGLPFQPFYSASKFAIEGLSDALRLEIQPFGVRVVVVNPGDFATSNTDNRINIVREGGPYEAQFDRTRTKFEHDERHGGNPEVMAKVLLKIVESRKPCSRYVVGTFEQKLSVWLKRLLPTGLHAALIGGYYLIAKPQR